MHLFTLNLALIILLLALVTHAQGLGRNPAPRRSVSTGTGDTGSDGGDLGTAVPGDTGTEAMGSEGSAAVDEKLGAFKTSTQPIGLTPAATHATDSPMPLPKRPRSTHD